MTGLELTPRDQAILRAAWSLGYAPAHVLRRLASPTTSAGTFGNRLYRLHRARLLVLAKFIAPAGGLWLYGIGRAALLAGDAAPWRPGLSQVEHTLAVADAVVHLQRPGFAAPLQVSSWQGEAELRAWALPGAPFPDARLEWSGPAGPGVWLLELDRATESRAAWRRKLARYLAAPAEGLVLAATTSDARARNLAVLAADMGAPVLATTAAAIRDELDPDVYDARVRRRSPLSTCR
ncbi:MAG: hypothetical protein NVSMB55_12940 [Mycobacteriales bacterium]